MRNCQRAFVAVALCAPIMALFTACLRSKVAESEHLPPRVRAQLELTRSRKYEELSSTKQYLASSAGAVRGEERCAMLIVAAFSGAMLKQISEGEQHLAAFHTECSDYPLLYGWHTEASRVRRLLNGEPAISVYPSANAGETSGS